MTDKIILYSNGCPKCNVLTKKLNDANITYEKVSDVDLMLKKGFNTVPILEVNGEVMDFNKANMWINERGN